MRPKTELVARVYFERRPVFVDATARRPSTGTMYVYSEAQYSLVDGVYTYARTHPPPILATPKQEWPLIMRSNMRREPLSLGRYLRMILSEAIRHLPQVFRIRGTFYRRYGIYRQSNSSGSMWKERYMTLPTLCHVAIRPSSS